MGEMGRRVAHADRVRHAEAVEHLGLALHRVLGRGALVEGEVDERRGHVFDGLEAHVVGRRRQEPVAERVRHGLAGVGMGGEFADHLGHFEPVLVELAREFHEIAGDRGAGDRFVGDVREHLVERVAELVEKRPRVVPGQKRRGAVAGPREVADVEHVGPHVGAVAVLGAEGRAPGARALGGAGEVVADEDRHVGAVARDFPGAGVGVVERHIEWAEVEPEEAVRAGEGGIDHPVELQVGFELGLVEVVFGAPSLLGIVVPVPGFEPARVTVGVEHGLEHGGVGKGALAGRGPDPHQEVADVGGCLRHLGLELVVGEGGVAEERRALGPEREDLGGDGAVVGFASVRAASGPGLVGFPAEVAAGRELEERGDDGAGERDRGAVEALFSARGAGGFEHEAGQAVGVLGGEEHVPAGFVGQEVLGERGAEDREAFLDRGQAVAGRALELRARADEAAAGQGQDAHLFGVEAEGVASLPQRVDPGEEGAVHGDLGAVGGEFRREGALERVARVVRVGPGDAVEGREHPAERLVGAFERADGVGEGRRFGVVRDGGDGGAGGVEGSVEGRGEVVVGDGGEGRQAERGVPGGEKRVGHGRAPLGKRPRAVRGGGEGARGCLPLALPEDTCRQKEAGAGVRGRPGRFACRRRPGRPGRGGWRSCGSRPRARRRSGGGRGGPGRRR